MKERKQHLHINIKSWNSAETQKKCEKERKSIQSNIKKKLKKLKKKNSIND